jgi:hypothetical protein
VLQASITHALPPLDDVPPDEAAELAALALLGDVNLWQVARAIMPAEDQTEVHALLDRQGARELTPVEHSRLQALMEIYGRITVRKAHASLLLARRGYRVPMCVRLDLVWLKARAIDARHS